jgi:D-glycero-alpha-D-manno-heptose-7-phosphate kinase
VNEAIASAPLRLSLAGGGTDLPEHYSRHGCHLLACAIPHRVRVTIRPHREARLVLPDGEETAPVVARLSPSLVRTALVSLGVDRAEVVVESGLPAGSGLGGSGALLVALVAATRAASAAVVDAAEAAQTGFAIERHDAARVVGCQDHWAAALGGVVRLRVSTDGVASARREPALEEGMTALMEGSLSLFQTPLRRSAADVLAVTVERLGSDAGARQSMQAIAGGVDAMGRAIATADAAALGALVEAHWAAKKRVNPGATTASIDRWLDLARAHGATGGKVIGAGRGGHLLVVHPRAAEPGVRAALAEEGMRLVPLGLERAGLLCGDEREPGSLE